MNEEETQEFNRVALVRKANQRFENNNAVNDQELEWLIDHYLKGFEALRPLGSVFHLARVELMRRFDICVGWKKARAEDARREEDRQRSHEF